MFGGIGLFYGMLWYSDGDPIGMFFFTPDNFNEEAVILLLSVGGAILCVFGIGLLGCAIFPGLASSASNTMACDKSNNNGTVTLNCICSGIHCFYYA